MGFTSVRYYRFRNIHDCTIDFDAPEVFLVGENGQGKSNILESIYVLCYGSSFRTRREQHLVRHGESVASLSGSMRLDNEETLDIRVRLRSGAKEITVNDSPVDDRRDIIRNIPCIVFCHDDIRFVSGSPEDRRWFFNQTLSLYDDVFLDTFRRYGRILKSRNAALRAEQYELLDAYDPQLAEAGLLLQQRRIEASVRFSEQFADLYHLISGFETPLTIEYHPSWRVDAGSLEPVLRQLHERRETDKRLRTTTSGPHRDRFSFVMDGREFTDTASTGQLRLVSLVLRVAQSRFFGNHSRRRPLLLLDDVMLELDPLRRNRFFENLPEYDQAIFTFLPDEQFSSLRRSGTLIYAVADGAVYGTSGQDPAGAV